MCIDFHGFKTIINDETLQGNTISQCSLQPAENVTFASAEFINT